MGKRHLPAISSAADGGFVVAWGAGDYDAEFSNPSARDVLVRRFASDGNAIGEAFRANSSAEGRQVTPAVTHITNASFVVVWEDGDGHEPPGAEDVPSRDGDGFGLFGKLFDEAGSPAAAEFQVNTYTVEISGSTVQPRGPSRQTKRGTLWSCGRAIPIALSDGAIATTRTSRRLAAMPTVSARRSRPRTHWCCFRVPSGYASVLAASAMSIQAVPSLPPMHCDVLQKAVGTGEPPGVPGDVFLDDDVHAGRE